MDPTREQNRGRPASNTYLGTTGVPSSGRQRREPVLAHSAGAGLAGGDRPAANPTCACGHRPRSGGPPVATAPAWVPRWQPARRQHSFLGNPTCACGYQPRSGGPPVATAPAWVPRWQPARRQHSFVGRSGAASPSGAGERRSPMFTGVDASGRLGKIAMLHIAIAPSLPDATTPVNRGDLRSLPPDGEAPPDLPAKGCWQ